MKAGSNLGAAGVVSEEIEEGVGRDGQPDGGDGAENDSERLSRVVQVLPGRDSNIVPGLSGHLRPRVVARSRDRPAETRCHSLRQL